MRGAITLFEDQYSFYKELKSPRLLRAFVEFMFEDIEPTDLKWIEKTAFNSLRIRMENQKKKSYAWTQSHGGGRPGNPSSELDHKNNTKTTQKQQKNNTTNNRKTTKKQEVISISNILPNGNIYTVLFSNYYWKNKWIDEKVCSKLLDAQIAQWTTLDEITKSMVLYNCECRIKQEFTFVKKFETWIKEYQPTTPEQMDEELYRVVKAFINKKKTDDKFWTSAPAKTILADLKETFWDEKIKQLRKQANSIQLSFT